MGNVNYGPVLSDEEYERRIFELYHALPEMPSAEAERELRRRELDILVDHRLGSLFPADRREALWAAQQAIERRRLRSAMASMARAVFGTRLSGGRSPLVGFAIDEYAKVL